MKCQKCKENFNEREIHEHHIHPRFMNNKNGFGMKCYLCKKCHDILHLKISSILWRFISDNKKQQAINCVIKYTNNITK